jgi:hypothetical protein
MSVSFGRFVLGQSARALRLDGQQRALQPLVRTFARRGYRFCEVPETAGLGWNPQPGPGLLLAERGDPEGGIRQLERALSQPTSSDGQRVSAAELAQTLGEFAWAQEALPRAEQHLRDSVAGWLELGAPVHAAGVRLRLSELLLRAGDPTAAELEVAAAESAFEHVQAESLVARCLALRDTAFRKS